MRIFSLRFFLGLAFCAALTAFAQPRLINLSTRAHAGTGADVLTAGFVVSGGASKTVLVRALGPTLASYGLAGTLADPVVTVVDSSGRTVASNDNWQAADAATMTSVGAFALTTGSKDAALVTTLTPGAYTAQVTSADGTSTGLALVEIYEVTGGASTLLNLSTRANIGTGASVAIPGIVISPGVGTRRLLVRAAGPALANFGLTGVLADPTITLTDGTGLIAYATNDNWGTPLGSNAASATTVSNAFAAVGAFGFASGSKDAAFIAELAPGSYTLAVSGVNNTTGLALVEVYDVTGTTISTTATAPTITTQPANLVAVTGSTATLSVTATGTNPLTYQWRKDGTAISGATNSTYTIAAVAAANAGSYTVVVTNSAGSATSGAATLALVSAPTGSNTPVVVAAAQGFLGTLSATQQATAQIAWDLATARRWSNLPASFVARNGVSWGSLSTAQKAAASTLISSALSTTGNTLWLGLQAADDYLAANGGGNSYGNGNYYIAILGTPSTTSFWVLQLTGHHLTYNISFNGSYKSPTPPFLGVEPKGSFTVNGSTYDPMQAQRTAASDLMAGLGTYTSALLSGTYTDLLFGANGAGGIDGTYPKAYPTGTSGRGLIYGSLSTADQEKVKTFIRSYVNTQAAEYANALLEAYLSDAALQQTYVGYAGAAGVTTSNSYLRIDGPRVWIEFSVQRGMIFNNDIHYHTIWRDKLADYGGNF